MENKGNPRITKSEEVILKKHGILTSNELLEKIFFKNNSEEQLFLKKINFPSVKSSYNNEAPYKGLKANKLLSKLLKKSSDLSLSSANFSDTHALYKTYKDEKEFSGLHEFLEYLVTKGMFQKYENIQFMTHQKGSSYATSFSIGNLYKSSFKRIAVKDFNDLFNSVNKSRSKIFDNSHIKSPIIETNGNLLASINNHSTMRVILLVSNGGFLKYSNTEISNFDNVSEILLKSLTNYAKKNQVTKDKELLERMIKLSEIKVNSEDTDGKAVIEYNTVMEKYEKEIIHLQRITLLGELLNTLRHELNNPIFGIKIICQTLLAEEDIKEQFFLKEIDKNCDRAQEIINSFSNLYNQEEQNKECDLEKIISDTLRLVKSESRHIKKSVNKKHHINALLNTNPTWISQIIFNLSMNALQAIGEKSFKDGETPEIKITINEDDKNIHITFEDNGPGVPSENIHRIFTPFFTTKTTGTGLGLAICSHLVSRMRGSISLNHSYINGTSFLISLPKKVI